MSADAAPTPVADGGRGRERPSLDRVRGRRHLSVRAVATRAITVVLWIVVCASAASGFTALAHTRRLADGGGPVAPAGAGVEGFAAVYVAAYLEDAAAAVRAFNSAVAPPEGTGRGERLVARAATVRVVPEDEHAWAATVAAEVLVAADGGYRRDGLRWFRVGVARDGDGYVATSLPGEIAAPVASPAAGEASNLPPPEGRAGRLLQGFFESFLAGAPGLDRYLSADALLAPLDPPIARSVTLEGLRVGPGWDGRSRRATAQVRIVDRTGSTLVYQYGLRLTALEGAWRVEALLPSAGGP